LKECIAQAQRVTVEPVIVYLKSDGRLARNFLKGIDGDAINAPMCGAGHNVRKVRKKPRLLCARSVCTLRQSLIAFGAYPRFSIPTVA